MYCRSSAFTITAVAVVLLMMPLAHTVVVLLRQIENLDTWIGINLVIGFTGFFTLWLGTGKSEVKASLLGFIGAHLMFIGFFEFTFSLFAKVFNVQPLLNPETGNVLLSPSLQINEASFFILLPIFLLFYANEQVRCNMIVWLRKQLRMKTPPSQQTHRGYARITAAETLFIIWMIYAISLLTMDPRVLGPTHWLSMTIYTWFLIWPVYLLYRVIKIRTPGRIFRYAIPIGILLWTWVEMLSSMKLITEFYLQPLSFPKTMIGMAVITALLVFFLYRTENETKKDNQQGR